MNPTLLLIIGAPGWNTAHDRGADLPLDLPLKILITEDDDGAVWVTQNSVAFMRSRHAVLSDAVPLDAAIRLVTQAAGNESNV